MTKIVRIEDGVASQFKSQMQSAFDFLVDCDKSIDNCQIVSDLGFDINDSMKFFKDKISNTKDRINNLLGEVSSCENELLELDSNGTQRVESVFPIEDTHGDTSEQTTPTNTKGDTTTTNTKSDTTTATPNNSSNTDKNNDKEDKDKNTNKNNNKNSNRTNGSYGGSSSDSSSNYGSGSNTNTNTNNNGTNNTNNTTTNNTNTTNSNNTNNNNTNNNNNKPEKIYQFILNENEAIKAGDIFATDQYNLTEFTNYLLYKYNITDEKVAKKIYQSVLNYGNNYYNSNNNNPLKNVPEKEILTALYNDIKSLVPTSNENTFWTMLKNVRM